MSDMDADNGKGGLRTAVVIGLAVVLPGLLLVLVFVAVCAVAALTTIGNNLAETFDYVADEVDRGE